MTAPTMSIVFGGINFNHNSHTLRDCECLLFVPQCLHKLVKTREISERFDKMGLNIPCLFAPFFRNKQILEGNNRISVAHAGKIVADRPFFRAGLSDISAVFFGNLVNVFTEVFI